MQETNGTARYGHNVTDFQKLRTLGTGTFGRVYLVQFRSSNRFYALKMLRKIDVVRLKQTQHIASERDILARISHPFIDIKHVYLLEEYVIGGELFSHLRRAGRFSNEMTKFYAAEITLAIEYLHKLNIVYRDLKPENLLLDHNGHIKIADFGFAKLVTDRTWTLCGTPEYLAPEIIQSKGHTKAVDWWALGILIFEMLAGYPPFFDDNPFGIYEKILLGRVALPPHLHPDAAEIIRNFLKADLSKRLGNLQGGSDDVKHHKWFTNVDWEDVLNLRIQAPIVPVCSGPGDARNFETYSEELDTRNDDVPLDQFQHYFTGF